MTAQRPLAVIFDVWKTLVPLSDEVKLAAFEETARTLGMSPSVLRGPWNDTRVRRETQPLGSYLTWLRARLGADWPEPAMRDAMLVRRRIHGSAFATPTPAAARVLSELRQRGLRTAAVSNGTSDVSSMMRGCVLGPLLEEIIVSADVGLMKPSVEIYRLAAARLGVPCNRCLYVGDGTDDELHGAEGAGMHAVMFDTGEGTVWAGSRISSLADLLIRRIP